MSKYTYLAKSTSSTNTNNQITASEVTARDYDPEKFDEYLMYQVHWVHESGSMKRAMFDDNSEAQHFKDLLEAEGVHGVGVNRYSWVTLIEK